jgi:serine/threonine protein kinase
MDKFKAKQLESLLIGKQVGRFTIQTLVNNGKSAAVFRATDNEGQSAAIKIFDSELVERFGHEIQTRRIEQEIALKGHSIPNLVKILDGGKTEINNNEYYFIAMQFVDGKNLKEFIDTQEYDNSLVKRIGSALFSVTESLLAIGIVHRDIKPENIMISKSGEIVLMDLGVLKLIGAKSFSDQEEKQFVGTLRYAPPEFLTRGEEDSPEGWKAVNLYQIGAVFHDLILKKELFDSAVPYSNLVIAIKEDAPKISHINFPYPTLQITRDLLIKNWKKRLEICSNERIRSFLAEAGDDQLNIKEHIDEILNFTSDHKSKFEEIEKLNRTTQEKLNKRRQIASEIDSSVDGCLSILTTSGLFNKLIKSKAFYFGMDKSQSTQNEIRNFLYVIEGQISNGFPRPLLLLTRIINDENALATIHLLAVFANTSIKINMSSPLEFFGSLRDERLSLRHRNISHQVYFDFQTFEAFNGTVGFDKQFQEALTIQILKLIKAALKGVDAEVKDELARRERYAKGEPRPTLIIAQPKPSLKFFEI